MIHLAWPAMLLVLPLPWLLRRFLSPVASGGGALFLPFAAQLGAAGRARPTGVRGRQLFFALLWLLLVLAAVRPQWLGTPQPVPTTGRRVMLAVDVSGSMQALDMGGGLSRLQVVQQVAGDFIARRHGDRVGLILFGSRPYLQAPLSPDLPTVREFLDEAVVGIAGPATALGDAIGLALKRLREDPQAHGSGKKTVLILLTDGSSNAGLMPPLEAARHAADAGLKIYTIGVGVPAALRAMPLGPAADLDERTLRQIARITGGDYFRAMDAKDLQEVYARIDALEPAAGRDQWFRPRSELYPWPLGLALVLSLPLVWFGSREWN